MSKNKSTKSNISLTSPKGSLIAQINNLRRELKDCKQSKKQTGVLSEKPMRDIFSNINKKSPKQKCVTSISSTAKDKFFKSSKEDFNSSGKLKISNLGAFQTEKSYFEGQKKQKMTKIDQKKAIQEEKQAAEISLSQILIRQRDRKLKMDIELNKLRKIIIKLGPQEIAQQLNYVISLVNVSLREYSSRIQILQKNQKTDQSDQVLLIKRQEQQIQSITNKFTQLEDEARSLKSQLKVKSQKLAQLEQINSQNASGTNDLRAKNEALESILKELDQKLIQLEEQNNILSSKLLKKQEQVLFLNQDINYLRLQTQNFKQQKKQFSQLYEKTLAQFREYKRSKTLQAEKLQQQKDKWQKQCKLRRNQSEQIASLDQHKIALMKELADMRHLCTLKTSELQDKKALMHENQKKVIQLESEVYKLKSQIQTLRNQKQFSEFQNQKIREEFEDLKRYTRKNHSKQKYPSKICAKIQNEEESLSLQKDKTVGKLVNKLDFEEGDCTIHENGQKREIYNKKLREKEQKLRALQDIHSLIKKHRQEMQI